MSQPRRIPGLGAILAIALLIVPVAAVAWWLNRPRLAPSVGTNLTDLEVVCLGRVDGASPPISLDPSVPGRVVKLSVAEGQAVKEKDELLRLDDETPRLKAEEAKEAVTAADVEVRMAELEVQLHPKRKALQQAAVNAAEARAATARDLQRERRAAKEFGTVTAAELIAAEAEVRQQDHLVEIEKARLEELERLEPKLKVDAARARLAMALTAQKQAEKSVRDCVLRAPAAGVVLRVQTAVGESVAPGSPLSALVLRPEGPLVIRAEVEQEFLGRVKQGMKATIQDDVRSDSPTWTGTVKQVGGWVARKRSVLLDPGEVNDVRTVECVIALDGKPDGLLIGQRMRVRIGK